MDDTIHVLCDKLIATPGGTVVFSERNEEMLPVVGHIHLTLEQYERLDSPDAIDVTIKRCL